MIVISQHRDTSNLRWTTMRIRSNNIMLGMRMRMILLLKMNSRKSNSTLMIRIPLILDPGSRDI